MMNEDKQNKRRFTVKVLGQKLIVTGDISQSYIKEVVEYINNIGQDITGAYPHLPRRQLLGLTAVNLADEYFKLEEKYQNKEEKNEELREENDRLKNELDSIKQEYEELAGLLEEVDG